MTILQMPEVDRRPIYGADGDVLVPAARPVLAWQHDPARPTDGDFARYCDWRTTKCRPRDVTTPEGHIAEVNQALHEFVGEVAELGELLHAQGVAAFTVGRPKLIDEIGDVFFCGAWLLDAYGPSPLRQADAPSADMMISPERADEASALAGFLHDATPRPLSDEERGQVMFMINQFSWQMGIHAGLLCNSFKKTVYQERPQPLDVQLIRVLTVLSIAAYFLIAAGSSVSEALRANITKLDARYPNGYEGPGGGNRTGKGAGSETVG